MRHRSEDPLGVRQYIPSLPFLKTIFSYFFTQTDVWPVLQSVCITVKGSIFYFVQENGQINKKNMKEECETKINDVSHLFITVALLM